MPENYDDSDCPTNTGRDCQSSSSSPSENSSARFNGELLDHTSFGRLLKFPAVFLIFVGVSPTTDDTLPPWTRRTPLPSYTLKGGSSPMVRSPSMPLATTAKPEGAASSPRTLAISQSTVGKHHTHTTIHGMSVSEPSPSEFPLYNPASPSSETERLAVIEGDALSTTIPVVRGVVCIV